MKNVIKSNWTSLYQTIPHITCTVDRQYILIVDAHILHMIIYDTYTYFIGTTTFQLDTFTFTATTNDFCDSILFI